MDKIFAINKPINWTSNDVVQKIKKSLHLKKVGHGGTLDPLATGVLIIAIDEATKLLSIHLNDIKEYECEILFGIETDTFDLEGKIINQCEVKDIDLGKINQILKSWKKEYLQMPPLYSAIKINGKPLYKYARDNKEIEIKPRNVKLLDYEIISFAENLLKLKIKVSKGFYVRSLAHDLGQALKSCATVHKLIRTRSGNFCLSNAYDLNEFIKKYHSLIKV